MEPLTAQRRKLAGIVLVVALGLVLAVLAYRRVALAPLGQLARPGLPMLDLHVKLLDVHGQLLDTPVSKIATGDAAPSNDRCPELVGGDSSNASALSEHDKRPADCPKVATWYVKRHPIGLSWYVGDGEAVMAAFERNPRWQALIASRFVQGLFYEPLHSASVRAEDLHLTGLQGEFLRKLISDALAAHAQLHYDVAHGSKGFVLSFVRDESPFAIQALPAVTGLLARSGYLVAKLPEPVLEMRVALQRIFLTQYQDRIYLANGLEALLNVIESLTPPSGGVPDAPLALTVRAEAFVDKLLPVVVGKPVWDLTASFDLRDGRLGDLRFPAGRYAQALHPAIFSGVLAGVPHDAFFAVAASFHLPTEMTAQDWRKLATAGPEPAKPEPREAGVALIWDIDGRGEEGAPLGSVGLAIASQPPFTAGPATEPADGQAQASAKPGNGQAGEESEEPAEEPPAGWRRYLADPALGGYCAGGTVFLAASSPGLFARMQESCAGQSLSLLDWQRGALRKTFAEAQLLLAANPAVALRELFLAGGAAPGDLGDFEPQWKQQYEQAKAAMREDGESVFRELPLFVYAGRVAAGADSVSLPGLMPAPGVSP